MGEGGSWFKELGCLGTIAAIVLVAAFALVVLPSIEDSRATQARAVAAVEESKAYARAAEAQAEVDQTVAEEEGELAQLVERNRQELALLREENRQFQERLILLATVIEGMDSEKLDRLEGQLDANRAHTSWSWPAVALLTVAVVAAGVVFCVGLLGWSLWRRRGRRDCAGRR